jgi:hypothetical protein
MTKQDLIQLLADNELDKLFGILRSHWGNNHELILLEGQWKDLQARTRSGVISNDQANVEAAKIRKGLLELLESSSGTQFAPAYTQATAKGAGSSKKSFQGIAIGAGVLLVVLFGIWMLRSGPDTSPQSGLDDSAAAKNTIKKHSKSRKLNISEAEPMTFAPGDFQYERVYSVIMGKVESVGGGRSLVTLKVGLNFKGIINHLFSTDGFRLIAPQLRGPLAPSNFFADVIDSKSYGEQEVKFEIPDDLTRFSVFLEGKEDRKWDFSIE